ncbi:MAG: OmpA family protein [Gammaproteobacteria bacterium]
MSRTLMYWVPALIAVAILTAFCVRHHLPLIAEDLETRSRLALNEADLADVTVERVDGLNIYLGGFVSGEDTRQRALETVEKVYGVYSAKDEMIEQAAKPVVLRPDQHRFSAISDKTQVKLTGMVRDPAMRASIVGAARRAFGERRVIDELTEVSSVPPEWTSALRELFDQLAGFTSGKLDVRGTHLSLVGSVTSSGRKNRAAAALTRVAGERYTSRLDVAILTPSSDVIENCQASINQKLETATIRFNSGSASISVDSYPLLEELADIVASCDGIMVDIQGHTDSDGDEQNNLRLSERRAQSVQRYFVDEGIDASKLKASGYGETQPRADNTTRDGRMRNRRIEFVITGN